MCHSLYTFLEWKGFLEKFILFKIFVWSLSEWVHFERNDFNSFCIRDIWIKDWAEIGDRFQKKWREFKTYVTRPRTPIPPLKSLFLSISFWKPSLNLFPFLDHNLNIHNGVISLFRHVRYSQTFLRSFLFWHLWKEPTTKSFKVPKICNIIFWIENDPPPPPLWHFSKKSSNLVAGSFPK